MTNNKSFIFLVAASLALGFAWLFAGWAGAGLGQAKTAVQRVGQAEKDLATLNEQVLRWEKAGAQSLGSVEPVALDAKFLPSELPKSALLLAGLYADHGYFNLRRFVFSWGETGGDVAGSVARMTVEGEKVFLGQRAPVTAAASVNINKGGRP
ncbi:MAG: hypothetical protein Q8L93_00710 [Rhodocyclaceae bacterium]|nr:hypothetical protein [Rhodocyclaceae bacterium]